MTAQLKISKDLSLPLDIAGEAVAILATRGAGKSYTSADLVEELYRAKVQTVVIDPTGVYWGLRSNADGTGDGLPIIVLGGAHGDVRLEETAGKLIADLVVDTAQSLVLDLSDFESDGAQCRFMTDFAERLYRRKARTRTTLHLVVDEADEFAPQHPQKNEARMLGAMAKFVRRGRSRGIGVTLITQRSASINKNLLDLVDTMVVMRMLGPRDRDAFSGWIKHKNLNDELGVLASLPSLPTGTAWIWSPMRDILQKVQMRRIETFDSYVTPKPGERRVEPKALAPVDIAKLGEQIKATAERAKADDPKLLRQEIARLNAQVKRLNEAAPAQADYPALKAEYERGFELGIGIGRTNALKPYRGILPALADISLSVKTLISGIEAVPIPTPLIAGNPIKDFGIPRGVQVHHKPAGAAESRRPAARGNGHAGPITTLPPGERAILTALAQHEQGCTREQLSILAGYKKSSRDAYIARLIGKGLAEARRDGKVGATSEGIHTLGADFEPLPTGEDLQAYWLARLPPGEALILQNLIAAYPREVTRDGLSQTTEYKKSSRDAYIARLRTRQLIQITGRGELRASDDLFGG